MAQPIESLFGRTVAEVRRQFAFYLLSDAAGDIIMMVSAESRAANGIETLGGRTFASVRESGGMLLLRDAADDVILVVNEDHLFDDEGNHFLTWDVEEA